jgi:hypothetical protein
MGRGRRFPCIGSKAQRTAFEKSELSMLILRERRSSDGATPAEEFPFNRQSRTPPPKAGGVTPPAAGWLRGIVPKGSQKGETSGSERVKAVHRRLTRGLAFVATRDSGDSWSCR